MYVCICICIYIYTYILREGEKALTKPPMQQASNSKGRALTKPLKQASRLTKRLKHTIALTKRYSCRPATP